MSSPFIGEIRLTPYNFAPSGWLYCDGSLQSISNYQALFALLGTTYGGDGQNTFGLPDLRSRVPVHQGNGYPLAQLGGTEQVTLSSQQLPTHYHPFLGTSNNANQNGPGQGYPSSATNVYTTDTSSVTALGPNPVSSVGGNQPHNNVMPFLGIAFIICVDGIYPSQN